jgi:hypothetical protein
MAIVVVAALTMAMAEEDVRLRTAAAEVLHRMVEAEEVVATAIRSLPVAPGANSLLPTGFEGTNRKSDGKQTVALSAVTDQICLMAYHTPLSLPVILNATAAAEASGGSRLSRNVAGTFPLNAACVICCV